jgi:hypothetical protein
MGEGPSAVLVDPVSGTTLAVATDGSDKKLDITTKVRDSDGAVIDPATEDGNLATLAAVDFATEATLAAIKDTDGVKKITDPLPAGDNNIGNVDLASAIPSGTNEIGKAAQGTRAAAAAGWPVYVVDDVGNKVGVVLDGAIYRLQTDTKLVTGTAEIGKVAQGTRAAAAAGWPVYAVDASGNAVGVILDGAVYRFATDAKISKGDSTLVHLDAIDTASGRGRLKTTLYTQDGIPVSFGSTPPNPESIKNAFIKNGTNDSLLVNGSVTPVVFSYNADATRDISIQELKFVMGANGITFGTDKFGVINALTNGLLIELVSDGNTGTVAVLNINECFVHLASPGGFIWVVSSKDMMASAYTIGGSLRLKAGTNDMVKVTVRDNLSSAATYFKCCVKGNLLEST